MTQGNDGARDPSLDPARDPLPGPPRDPWGGPRVEEVVRRSGSGEAVFTHGSLGSTQNVSTPVTPVPPVSPHLGASGRQESRRGAHRARGGVMGTGVPMVVVAFLGLLGFVGVAGLSLADDERSASGHEPVPIPGAGPPVDRVTGHLRPVRLTVPGSPVEIRTVRGGDVSVVDGVCLAKGAADIVDRRDITISCVDVDSVRPIVVSVPEGLALTVIGGERLTVGGDLSSLAVNGPTADVTVDGLATGALRVATSGEVHGRIRSATSVDVRSRNGPVDLQFAALVPRTTIQAGRREVSVEVPARTPYDLDLRAGKGRVSSLLPDTDGAFETIAITTNGGNITVTTAP